MEDLEFKESKIAFMILPHENRNLTNNKVKFWLIEGCLEVKLSTIWTDGKAKPGRKPEERRSEREKVIREKIREEKVERKKVQVHETVAKSQNSVFFQ